MKILSIGNSFSEDATRYLHEIAKADNYDLTTVNLFIGGCPLRTHYLNALEDSSKYLMMFNGQNTGFEVSIKQALTLISHEWDYVTFQQASYLSPDYNSYQPYLDFVADYVRKYAPKAKLLIHQTWAYAQDHSRLKELLGYDKYTDMLKDIKEAYNKAADSINAYGIIPSGEVMNMLLERGIEKVHRDGFHASLGLGRYTLGLLWYTALTGNSISQNCFCNFDEPVTEQEIIIAKQAVMDVIEKYKFVK